MLLDLKSNWQTLSRHRHSRYLQKFEGKLNYRLTRLNFDWANGSNRFSIVRRLLETLPRLVSSSLTIWFDWSTHNRTDLSRCELGLPARVLALRRYRYFGWPCLNPEEKLRTHPEAQSAHLRMVFSQECILIMDSTLYISWFCSACLQSYSIYWHRNGDSQQFSWVRWEERRLLACWKSEYGW
jgi:hypothetical protein